MLQYRTKAKAESGSNKPAKEDAQSAQRSDPAADDLMEKVVMRFVVMAVN